jgi:hypothetical protein
METKELVKKEEQHSEVAAIKIPFAQFEGNDQKSLEKLFNAPKLEFNTNASTWSPEDKGERKRLVFQGVKEQAKTKNIFASDPEFVYLDKVVFVEVYQEGNKIKQRMIESYATSLVGYMIENNVPRHAVMDVEYIGKEKARSGFMYDSFSINLVPFQG